MSNTWKSLDKDTLAQFQTITTCGTRMIHLKRIRPDLNPEIDEVILSISKLDKKFTAIHDIIVYIKT
jgi:hypothetical protein